MPEHQIFTFQNSLISVSLVFSEKAKLSKKYSFTLILQVLKVQKVCTKR